jgi:hypothetical protein
MNYGKSILKRFGSITVDLSNYVQKVAGKSLIADSEIQRLANVTGGTLTPEQLAAIASQVPVPRASQITEDETHRFTTDSEKITWSAKIDNSDPRLIDARSPLTHSHGIEEINGVVAVDDSRLHAPGSDNQDLSNFVLTGDSRLTNARPASDVSTWAKAATKPSYTASEVSALAVGVNTWKTGIATKNITDVSAVQNIAHGLGRVPKYVRIDGAVIITTAITQLATGIYDGTNNSGLTVAIGEGTSTAATDAVYTSTAIALGFSPLVATNVFTGANRQTGIISVDATNIIITWTKTGTVASLTASLIWQCT